MWLHVKNILNFFLNQYTSKSIVDIIVPIRAAYFVSAWISQYDHLQLTHRRMQC